MLIKWIDTHLEGRGVHIGTVRFGANADVVIHDALDTDYHLHGLNPLCIETLLRTSAASL